MTVDASTTTRAVASPRARTLSPSVALGLLVGISFVVRLAVVWQRATPALFPDEYIYTAISRSISSGGLPLIRGGSAHFPSLLAPILAAPVWWIHDVLVAYRVVQALQALSMSLAAIPVFLLARHLRLSKGMALAAAAVALAAPDFLYASFVVAEPFAYPLALAAIAAGVVALDSPTRRRQALFLLLCALAALARIQFVIVPMAFACAVAIVGLRERSLRRTAREQLLPLATFAAGALVVFAVGVGYYSDVTKTPRIAAIVASGLTNLLVLAYAAGWMLVPGALLGLGLALVRPADRRELRFAALVVPFGAGIVGQAALFGSAVHERYTFYLVPLLALAFAAYARRGWPYKLYHGLAAAALLTAATLMPLTSLSLRGDGNAPVLIAVHWLRVHLTSVGGTALIVLWVAGAGTALLVATMRRPRLAASLSLGAAIVLGTAAWALSADFDRHNTVNVRRQMLPPNRSWVDAFGFRHVTLLQAYAGQRADAGSQLFWNRSVDRVLLLPGSQAIDAFRQSKVKVAPDGTMRVGGTPVTGPLLVNNWASTVVLHDARSLYETPGYVLWQPEGTPRLALYFAGRYSDSWTAPAARLNAWDAKGRSIRFTVTLPARADTTSLKVLLPHGRTLGYSLAPGRPVTVTVPVCSAGAWHAMLRFGASGFVGARVVTAKSSAPTLVAGASCAARPAA